MRSRADRAVGLALGVFADVVFADPRRFHPVAGFGRAAGWLERALYRDDRRRGAIFTATSVGIVVALGAAAERVARHRPVLRAGITATATWAVLGGTSLSREGTRMAAELEAGDLASARSRLRNLCARDPTDLDAGAVARATVESLAENSSDAVVAPLLWGAVAGLPGLLGYRAVNTLDAMVGYRDQRYLRFGWASARLDDLANVVPARLAAGLTAMAAPTVGGSCRASLRVLRRDGRRHPSPNAGLPEAATAGALGVTLGGVNSYGGQPERRPELGEGPAPEVSDLRRAVRLGRVVRLASAVTAVGVAVALAAGGRPRAGRGYAPVADTAYIPGGSGRRCR